MSGYTYCACRDCMDVTVGSTWLPELCASCKEAGCLNYSHRPNLDTEGGREFACQRDDTYGVEEDQEARETAREALAAVDAYDAYEEA